jgi:hypothetical protein
MVTHIWQSMWIAPIHSLSQACSKAVLLATCIKPRPAYTADWRIADFVQALYIDPMFSLPLLRNGSRTALPRMQTLYGRRSSLSTISNKTWLIVFVLESSTMNETAVPKRSFLRTKLHTFERKAQFYHLVVFVDRFRQALEERSRSSLHDSTNIPSSIAL